MDATKNKRLYNIWLGMKQRCNNPNHSAAMWYHNKGIRVCDEWLNFECFQKWSLENGYKDNLTIDRIDSNKNYEPDNCQWITRRENAKKSNAVRAKNKNHITIGKFMVVKMGGRRMPRFAKVIKTGLTKADAIKLSNQLKEKEPYCNNQFYVRVTDGHKEGDIALWKELRQYKKTKSLNQ